MSSQNVTVKIPGPMQINITPIGFHTYASDFLSSASSIPPSNSYSPVPFYLYCRALELGLKAFLLAAGVPKAKLKSNTLGHDLVAVLAEANAKGLSALFTVSPAEEVEIKKANDYYVRKEFEYFENVFKLVTGHPDLPNPLILNDLLLRLLPSIKDICLKVA